MLQEGADERGVRVGKIQLAGLRAWPGVHEPQDQAPGVPVGGDGVRAGVALADQPFGEEGLEGGGEHAHASTPRVCSRRSAASDSSSGTADRYQLFRDRNNWYYSDSRVIPKSAPCHA